MKSLAIFGLTALAMIGCDDSSRETKQAAEEPHVLPEEHKEFVAEFNKLLERFPNAALRFKLADTGDEPIVRHVIIWKCKDVPGFGVDCKPEVLE